jgi:UDP-N-acetyl-D-mannosaminuronate dehydrogenase
MKFKNTAVVLYESVRNLKPTLRQFLSNQKFDAVVLGVGHKEFLDLASLQNDNSLLYEVKGILGTKG